MSVNFNPSSRGRARFFLLCSLGIGGLAGLPMQGRPIEFSEPGGSNLTVNVSSLRAKPADLPSVEDRVFRPHTYNSSQGVISRLKPMAASPAAGTRQNNRVPGLFDRDKSWLQQTPQEMLDSMLERDALKLPGSTTWNKPSEPWSASDPYNLQAARRRGAAKNEARGPARETNRLDGAATVLNASDPFAPFSSRRPSSDLPGASDLNVGRPREVVDWLHGGDDSSPDGRHERTDPASQLEAFRRNQGLQTPGGNPGWLNPAATPNRGNAFVTDVEKSSRSPGGASSALFTAPAAPLAPTAPLAPGQTSLTPAPYSPSAKPKPLNISAPRRSF